MPKTIDNLILIGRPASGKSEFIDYLKKLPVNERISKFRIGRFDEIDDFPWLWEKFVEDNMWEKLGMPRLCSKQDGMGNVGLAAEHPEYFALMIEKLNYEVNRSYTSNNSFYEENTLFIEFSRGGKYGYRDSLNALDPEILKKSVILYNEVSYDESCRKNIKRYEEKKQSSILAHRVTDETMEAFYKDDDWNELSEGRNMGALTLNGVAVPFAKANNEPESADPAVLDERYSAPLIKLFGMYTGQ